MTIFYLLYRRYSRSPRRDRRRDRYSRSRSKSRDRRYEKNDAKSDKNTADKSNAAGAKKTTMAMTGKKLPFIGRMPVFKKQTGKSQKYDFFKSLKLNQLNICQCIAEDESKKQEQPQQTINEKMEEEKLLQKKKQDELKLQIQQKQQLLQLQQKHAEAYNLAHPGQFANIYNTHGTIHHILPGTVQPEEYELMPDPMHYAAAMMTAAPPPPMPEPEVTHFEEANEPVLPPGKFTLFIANFRKSKTKFCGIYNFHFDVFFYQASIWKKLKIWS